MTRQILILTIFILTTRTKLCGQDTSSTRLLGKWLYLKTTVDSPGIKIGKGSVNYSYEFLPDSVYIIHYKNGKNKSDNRGKWYVDSGIIYLSVNGKGLMDKGSLADKHDFTITKFTELELIVNEGRQTH